MFAAIGAFLASAATAVAEGAAVAGTAIAEGATTAAAVAGDAITSGAAAVGEGLSSAGNAALSVLPETAQGAIKTAAGEFSTGFMDKGANLLVSDANGTTDWGKSLARMAGRGTRNVGTGIAKKILSGNGQQQQSRARSLINMAIGDAL